MLGWEFPPYSTGGLGTACYGLTKGLSNQGVNVTFVLPTLKDNLQAEFVKLIGANIKVVPVDSPIVGYMTSKGYSKTFSRSSSSMYGQDLFKEVYRFSKRVAEIAKKEDFDIIHAHDWMTFQAGINAKEVSNKPLVIHVHATEFDRTANNNVNQIVYDIERKGMHMSDSIIAVSNFTKNKITTHYGIDPSKVNVVHNAVELRDPKSQQVKNDKEKIVLFLGRITVQKGPDYFIHAAKRVLEHMPNVKFIIAGSGDMEPYIINKVAELGLSKNVLFTGFLKGKEVDKAYRMADVYVMPSVSEPFGITPLEAMSNNTPTIISKQSGVSEVIKNCLVVDFWDINELTNKIISVLKYPPLAETLSENASFEVSKFNWNQPARKCNKVYNDALVMHNG
jgi:glycosyltransferase involved in cell wall biosynthesis